MAKSKEERPGYGKLLDAWSPPDAAGDPLGCLATSFTFDPVFFEEECLSRFLHLESDAFEDGPAYLVEREEKPLCEAPAIDISSSTENHQPDSDRRERNCRSSPSNTYE